jgi:hypothetical protein
MRAIVIEMNVSCDDCFIERYAHKDPFQYFNDYIAPSTSQDAIPKDTPAVEVEIKKYTGSERTSLKVGITHKLTYTIKMWYDRNDCYVTAIIAYFGASNIVNLTKQ